MTRQERANEYQRNFTQRRKENGLCVNCGKPLDRAGSRCISCREKINAADRKQYQESKSRGMCPVCGKRKLWGDENACLECKTKRSENAMKNREKNGTEHYNKTHREWSRKTYEIRKQHGICTRCGKRPAQEGYSTCQSCRYKEKVKQRERRNINGYMTREERQEYRTEVGLCFFCDNPVKPGYKVCERHYNMNVESQKKVNREEIRRTMRMYFAREKNGKEIDTGENRKNSSA